MLKAANGNKAACFKLKMIFIEDFNVTMLRKALKATTLRGDIIRNTTITTVTLVTMVKVAINVMSRFKSLIISYVRMDVTL